MTITLSYVPLLRGSMVAKAGVRLLIQWARPADPARSVIPLSRLRLPRHNVLAIRWHPKGMVDPERQGKP